jgi:hypothetical protein
MLDPRNSAKVYRSVWLLIFLTLLMPVFPSAAQETVGGAAPFVQLQSPAENQVAIHKKPDIAVAFVQPLELTSLFIMLDGVDITQLAALSPHGFSYTPIQVMEPGGHTLTVSGTSAQGEAFTQEFGFSTRHYQSIEKGYSENELTAVAQSSIAKSDSMEEQVPDIKIEANLRSTSQIQEGGFDLSFNANARYLHQDIPPTLPEKTGGDLIDYLLTVNHTKGRVTTHAEMGDTNIVLSENTLPYLSRRGGQLSLSTDTVAMGGFSVNSAQTYGYDGELGIGSEQNKHIYGWYGDLNLLDNRMRLRLVRSAGGETGSSFGITTQDVDKEGSVTGVVLATDFFNGKLATEFEYDRAEFDGDTSDSQGAEQDNAYRLQFQGGENRYTYGLTYRYIGSNYEVIGNEGLEKDRAGFALNGGAGFDRHALSLTYSRYQDNVENDDALPVIVTHTGMVDYTYLGFESLPITLSYQKEVAQSSDEPILIDPTDRQVDTLSSSVFYSHNAWNIGFQGSYAATDDQTDLDMDTTNLYLALMPQYYSEAVSISPNLSYNQTQDLAADIATDSYTLGLDVQGRLWSEKFCYGLGGTLDFTATDDDNVDQRTTVYYFNLDYRIAERMWGYLSPVVGLRGESSEFDDQITDQVTRDYSFMLVFSTTALFSF